MKQYLPTMYTYDFLVDRFRAECTDRGMVPSRLFFEVFGERYAANDEDFRNLYRVMQREEELRDERKLVRKDRKEQRLKKQSENHKGEAHGKVQAR